jgi:hypothetical protein
MREEIGFWLAVAFVAIAAMCLFKWSGTTKLGDAIPGYRSLAAFA